MRTHHLLVATGPAEAAHRPDLRARARRLGSTLCFLQGTDPDLSTELTRLADDGVDRVVVVAVCTGTGPGISWVRRVVTHWWSGYGAGAPVVETGSAYLTDELDPVTERADFDRLCRSARPVERPGPGMRSAAWEEVPAHRHQVFVCRGPRCTVAGAASTARALVLATMEHGLGDDDVLLTQTGCQFPCNHAPVVSVQPDDVWYGRVTAEVAGAVVAEHLVGGVPHEAARLPRRAGVSDATAAD